MKDRRMFHDRWMDMILKAVEDGEKAPETKLWDSGAPRLVKSANDVRLLDILRTGLSASEAQEFEVQFRDLIRRVDTSDLVGTWDRIARELLKPWHPDALHLLLYHATYVNWEVSEKGPPPAWIPTR